MRTHCLAGLNNKIKHECVTQYWAGVSAQIGSVRAEIFSQGQCLEIGGGQVGQKFGSKIFWVIFGQIRSIFGQKSLKFALKTLNFTLESHFKPKRAVLRENLHKFFEIFRFLTKKWPIFDHFGTNQSGSVSFENTSRVNLLRIFKLGQSVPPPPKNFRGGGATYLQ